VKYIIDNGSLSMPVPKVEKCHFGRILKDID
jgi:hypothetical protein